MGEEGWNNKEGTDSPMWKFLREEYDYKRPQRGDIRYAEVLRIDDDEIIVDIGGKTEGVVPRYDLQKMGEEALAEIEVGDKVPVYVLRPESADGDVIVSLNMARTAEDWRRAQKLFEEGEVFEGTVSGYNKGGVLVYFGQIRGFVPSSQLTSISRQSSDKSRMDMLARIEGQELVLKVIEVDQERRRLIFSERAAGRQWRDRRKEQLLNELQEGDIRTGTVRNLCDFGAFVDLGGADGLIHISELSWRRVKHAREVLDVGDDVEVYVLRVDRERKRIGLSLKRLKPDPWQLAEEKYHAGQIVKGVITNVVNFGAFARVDDGIEGLIHISELADGDFSPGDLVKEGEEVYLKVLSVNADRERMSLSLKQAPTREEMEGRAALEEIRAEAALEPEVVEPVAMEGEPKEEVEAEVEPAEEEPVLMEAEEAGAEPEVVEPVATEGEPKGEVEAEIEPAEKEPVLMEAEEAADPELEGPVEAETELDEGLEAEVEAAEDEGLSVQAQEAAVEPSAEAVPVEDADAGEESAAPADLEQEGSVPIGQEEAPAEASPDVEKSGGEG